MQANRLPPSASSKQPVPHATPVRAGQRTPPRLACVRAAEATGGACPAANSLRHAQISYARPQAARQQHVAAGRIGGSWGGSVGAQPSGQAAGVGTGPAARVVLQHSSGDSAAGPAAAAAAALQVLLSGRAPVARGAAGCCEGACLALTSVAVQHAHLAVQVVQSFCHVNRHLAPPARMVGQRGGTGRSPGTCWVPWNDQGTQGRVVVRCTSNSFRVWARQPCGCRCTLDDPAGTRRWPLTLPATSAPPSAPGSGGQWSGCHPP